MRQVRVLVVDGSLNTPGGSGNAGPALRRNMTSMHAAPRSPTDRARALMEELVAAHARLVEAMRVMGEETARDEPDLVRYPRARWRLSLASRHRRATTAMTIAELLGMAAPQAAELKRLQVEDLSLRRHSAAHIQRWTMQTIEKDWQGYCRASAEIRQLMARSLAVEQAVLYPLLGAMANSSLRRA